MSGAIVDLVEATDDAVDVFVTGHTHKAYNCKLDGSIVTSAASYGRLVTEIHLTLDRETGDVTGGTAHNHPVTRDRSDPEVAKAVAHYTALAAPLAQRVVGHIGQDLTRTKDPAGQSTLGGVVADAHLAAMQLPEFGGADVAFMNAGGLRADLVRSITGTETQEGVVTYEEVFAAQPFGNVLAVQTFTGGQFIALLEEQFTVGSLLQVSSTLQYAFSASAAPGAKVDPTSVKVNGAVVNPDDEVRVVVNGYVADGGDGFTLFVAGKDRHNGPVDVDALAAYLGTRGEVSSPQPGRVTRLP
jgi:5'-nucleotidase